MNAAPLGITQVLTKACAKNHIYFTVFDEAPLLSWKQVFLLLQCLITTRGGKKKKKEEKKLEQYMNPSVCRSNGLEDNQPACV